MSVSILIFHFLQEVGIKMVIYTRKYSHMTVIGGNVLKVARLKCVYESWFMDVDIQ